MLRCRTRVVTPVSRAIRTFLSERDQPEFIVIFSVYVFSPRRLLPGILVWV